MQSVAEQHSLPENSNAKSVCASRDYHEAQAALESLGLSYYAQTGDASRKDMFCKHHAPERRRAPDRNSESALNTLLRAAGMGQTAVEACQSFPKGEPVLVTREV